MNNLVLDSTHLGMLLVASLALVAAAIALLLVWMRHIEPLVLVTPDEHATHFDNAGPIATELCRDAIWERIAN